MSDERPAAEPFQAIFPEKSTEYVTSLAHYYRGEISRLNSWRDRLDRTTNWAIGAVAAMLSVSLSTRDAHHGVLLFAMLLVLLLLVIESRRYRFFDVYRTRVRLLERNYFAAVFVTGERVAPDPWEHQLAENLHAPRFSLTLAQALARRLRRNYGWIFSILLLAWLVKGTTTWDAAERTTGFVGSVGEFVDNVAIGSVPGWAVLTTVAGLYGWMVYMMVRHREMPGELGFGEVHV